MKLSRRAFLGLGVGATQFALLDRFGLNRANASPAAGGPTKLLSIYIPGGISHQEIWCPFTDAGIAKYIPPPMGGSSPYFYNAQMVKNYDGTTGNGGPYQKIRGPIWWNPQDPTATTPNPDSNGAQNYVPWGQSWVSTALGNSSAVYDRACMIHGIDQGTAAHGSGIIAGLCGVAGGDFRAPAIAAVVANAMLQVFPDRPLPSVSIGGMNPKALTTTANPMSSAASAIYLNSITGLEITLSDHTDSAWAGLRTRHNIDEVNFDGTPTGRTLPVTAVEEEAMSAVRALKGKSSAATDSVLQQLHDTYGGVSRVIARDVVDVLNNTKGPEYLPAQIPWGDKQFSYHTGYADFTSSSDWNSEIDLTLRLLKSDLATAVTLRVPGGFDTHDPPAAYGQITNLRGTFEIIGQLMIEMMLTPSPSQPGKSLLDETVVHIFSDFGRTFSTPLGGTDHHPATTMILLGGNVQGNRMIGGYDETIDQSPLGVPVDVINIEEGGGSTTSRVPRAADAAATVFRAFGLEAGKDFFIPGGYGEVAGVLT